MSRIDTLWRKAKLLALTAAMWLTVYGPALAKKRGVPPEPPPKSEGVQGWVMPYFLVLLAIGLGMLVVCRSSRRSERAKPKQYESMDLTR